MEDGGPSIWRRRAHGVNINLFLAGLWAVIGLGIFLWPAVGDDGSLGIDPTKRVWMVGFCGLLVGYNLVRAWLTARGKRLREERRQAETEARRAAAWLRRRAEGEQPNPDFDFSEPDRRDPAGPNPD